MGSEVLVGELNSSVLYVVASMGTIPGRNIPFVIYHRLFL